MRNFTRKQLRRGGGCGASKQQSMVETPGNALRRGVNAAISASRKQRLTYQEMTKLRREKEALKRKIRTLSGAITRKRRTGRNVGEIQKKETEVEAARKRIGEINKLLGEKDEELDKAVENATKAANVVAGVGEQKACALEKRQTNAEKAVESAERGIRNAHYAAETPRTRKRIHNADRRATKYFEKRTTADLIKKYKKKGRELDAVLVQLSSSNATPELEERADELEERADYLERFMGELYERISRKTDVSASQLVELKNNTYRKNNLSPNTPNSI
jgi:hypothetical protein